MKLSQTTSSEATRIGDIQNNKVGIDRSNIDFITTLLTSNLYSKPIQSFIRETVANGWDSQVEAGTTSTPLLIRITESDGKVKVAIRDYGTGLSPERFNDIYLNIGSSTKRDSNDYIGQMGIGRFACLSCSDLANVTSYYNGTCYQYIMYKDGAGICIDKVSEAPTVAENGVEVAVVVGERWDYRLMAALDEGIAALHFYDNVFLADEAGILGSAFVDRFNNRKIHSFKSFKVTSSKEYSGCQVLMGNVCYPIDGGLLDSYLPGIAIDIAITCPIGSLDVTPNRESLLYNVKTKTTLEECLSKVLEEIREICNTQIKDDFPSVENWYNYIHANEVNIQLYQFPDLTLSFKIPEDKLSHYCRNFVGKTIAGQHIPADLDKLYKAFLGLKYPTHGVTYEYKYEKFYQKGEDTVYLQRYMNKYQIGQVYALNEAYKPVTKQYLVQNLDKGDGSILFVSSRSAYRYFIKAVREFAKAYCNGRISQTMKMIWKDFRKHYTDPKTFNNCDVPQSFLDNFKATPTGKRKVARKCVIYTLVDGKSYNYYLGRYNVTTDSTLYTVDTLIKSKCKVVYADKDSATLRNLYTIFKGLPDVAKRYASRYLFVEVAPTNLPILADLKNTVNVADLLKVKDNAISKICTAIHIAKLYKLDYFRRSRWGDLSIVFQRNPGLLTTSNKLDSYTDIYDKLKKMSDEEAIKNLLDKLYTTYRDNGWLDNSFLQDLKDNPTFLELRAYVSKISNNTVSNTIAIAAFLEKRKYKVASMSAWKKLNEAFKPIYQHEPIQITQSSSTHS